MKSFLKVLPVLGATLALATNAVALPMINGSISMSGGVALDSTMLSTAKAATSFTSVTVQPTPSGTFTGTAGSSVTYNPFVFNPAGVPVNPLWTFTSGGNTYTFNLDTLAIVTQNNMDLILSGFGTLMATGYADTPGNWRFTVNDSSGGHTGSFDFAFSSTDHALPDGGATAMLLGLGLTGLAMLARMRKIV